MDEAPPAAVGAGNRTSICSCAPALPSGWRNPPTIWGGSRIAGERLANTELSEFNRSVRI